MYITYNIEKNDHDYFTYENNPSAIRKVQRIQNKNKADNTEKVASHGGVLCACTHALP